MGRPRISFRTFPGSLRDEVRACSIPTIIGGPELCRTRIELLADFARISKPAPCVVQSLPHSKGLSAHPVFDTSLLAPIAKERLSLALSESALLRPLREQDVTRAYVDGLNDPRVSRYLVGPRLKTQTLATVCAYVKQAWLSERDVLFGAIIDGGLRGTVRLYEIDDKLQAVMGIALFDTAYWGKGWGSRCIRRVAEYGTHELGLRRIVAGSYQANAGAIKSFAKAGFVRTPERDYDDGYDRWIMSAYGA